MKVTHIFTLSFILCLCLFSEVHCGGKFMTVGDFFASVKKTWEKATGKTKKPKTTIDPSKKTNSKVFNHTKRGDEVDTSTTSDANNG